MMREWPARIAATVVMLAMTAPIALGLGQRDGTLLRTVRGTVVDSQGRTLASSVVYLYQEKTHAVRTQIADGNGQYRFSGLNPHADYQIHAEHEDWTSSAHRLSAADGKRDVVLDLKVDKRKTRVSLLPDGQARGNRGPWNMTGAMGFQSAMRLGVFVLCVAIAKYEPRNTLLPG